MRAVGLLRLALVCAMAAACGREPVVFVEDVDALTDALARHRGNWSATVELAEGTHYLEKVLQLPPGVTLRGDPDGGTVLDGTALYPRPWLVVDCDGKRSTAFPQPMVEYTRNTIEGVTFANGEALLGPAPDATETAITLHGDTFLGAPSQDPFFDAWPSIGVRTGNFGCAGNGPSTARVQIEGSQFLGGFVEVLVVNITTHDGASWTAEVRDNVFEGLYTGLVALGNDGSGDLEASGNQWIHNFAGPNLGPGADAPVLFGIPFGPAADIDGDGVPDLVFNSWYEPFPLPLAEFTGMSLNQGDPTPDQLPGLDYGWYGPDEDGSCFVLPVRDGSVDGFVHAELKGEIFDDNVMSLLAMVEHHDALAAPSTGNWLDLEIEDSTFGVQWDLDLLLSAATEFGGAPSADNLTTVEIRNSTFDACAFGSTLFPEQQGLPYGCDPGTWGPDEWGNTLVVEIE